MRTLLILALSLSQIASAEPIFKTGNELLSGIKEFNRITETGEGDEMIGGLALGYISGIASVVGPADFKICVPDNLSQGQVLDVVYKFLNENPELRNRSGRTLIVASLMQDFPCND